MFTYCFVRANGDVSVVAETRRQHCFLRGIADGPRSAWPAVGCAVIFSHEVRQNDGTRSLWEDQPCELAIGHFGYIIVHTTRVSRISMEDRVYMKVLPQTGHFEHILDPSYQLIVQGLLPYAHMVLSACQIA